MKIITDNSIYVQKNDIAYLNKTNLEIPTSIFLKVFSDGNSIIDDTNRYEFVEFDDPKEIEFFKSINWMIDYNEVKDLSEEEIINLGQSIAQKKNIIAKRFNSMSYDKKRKNMKLRFQYELLDFKIYSLRDILWCKQGLKNIKLPEDIDLPTQFIHEKGIKKLIKNIFNKN